MVRFAGETMPYDAIYVSKETASNAYQQYPDQIVQAGSPGFGQGPIYVFDAGNGAGYVYYSFRSGPAPSPAGSAASISTGVNPSETQYSLYGHTIPLSALGKGRIGGEIISGPWIENGAASFIISFGMPADPSGTRILHEIAFDSQVVWTGTLTGSGSPTASGFKSEPFTCRFYDGKLTQPADTLETLHFGSNAVAYRPQMLIAFDKLPLANTKFKKVPYVAAVLSDASGEDVNLGEMFERVARSPWVGYTSGQFETSGITDIDGGLILAQDTDFLSLLQQYQRFYKTWDILQTDKLRVVDRGTTLTPDIVLDDTCLQSVTINRQGHDTTSKILELTTIDPDADYSIIPYPASIPSEPAAVTTSVAKETAYLPSVMDAHTRAALATFAKYHDEQARKTIRGTATARGLQMEPGDYIAIQSVGEFGGETFKAIETLHGANYTVEFIAQAILGCTFGTIDGWDPTTIADVLLSLDLLTVTSNGAGGREQGIRVATSHAKSTGKFYFEITVEIFSGFGVTTGFGVGDPASTYTGMGESATTGVLLHTYPTSIWSGGLDTGINLLGGLNHFADGDVIGIAVDLDNRKAWFKLLDSPSTLNSPGFWNGEVFADPATNVSGVDIPLGAMVPFTTFNANGNVHTANFGRSGFVGAIPAGFGPGWPL